MNPGKYRRSDKGALEILEEATHLLRRAPVATLLCYYIGSLPFVLGLLFFCTDMSSSGTARAHLIRTSFELAVLFLWMKCWQAVFVARLRALLADAPPAPWTLKRILRLVGLQMAAMPWEFVALPLASFILLPFGWCYALFHNLSVVASGREGESLKGAVRTAWRQASLWPSQNHKMILIILPFVLFAYINLCTAAYLAPRLLSTFFGVETIFSMSNSYFLNTTFWLSMAGITYLCIDPLIKSAYLLRCYYGDSLYSGRDLLSELRRLSSRTLRTLALLLTLSSLWGLAPLPAGAAREPVDTQMNEAAVQERFSPKELDRAIAEELEKLQYTWRLSASKAEEGPVSTEGFLAQVIKAVGGWLHRLWTWMKDGIDWFLDWLMKWLMEHFGGDRADKATRWNVLGTVKGWLAVLLAAAIGITCVMLLNYLKHRMKAKKDAAGEPSSPVQPLPDLADEATTPEVLPVASWLDLGTELLAKGETRLALRAFYFAVLGHLAHRSLLNIARFKSNRDYERELARRAHALPELVRCFSENVAILECIWYGMHDIRREMFDQFLTNHKRIMEDA